ncbi:hypothetical protein BU202_08140 [Streptococcus cuniculi]|uniref:DUF1642 domain-containing protein n=1 Tax=Streptococcus cuniculi TaxID=1432788 RepID=A0A1Q8E668_9STRE|nr:DUF1642 domain-containing protein [Streptococcus cuniculi]OLF47286.1 hypothetical protein BU202_08140 [Streptococcus cuniculi]QBX23144.1 hypothetical protein Javan116_0015 [Streptococcus phage Javan116]
MNKQELLNRIDELPSNLIGNRVAVDKSSVVELVKLLDERPKVKIPQFVAEYLEQQKQRGKKLFDALFGDNNEAIIDWLNMNNNEEILVRAWLDGYEVEQEKLYKVKMVGLYKDEQVLHHSFEEDVWYFKSDFNDGLRHQRDSRYHTKNELEQAGFGGVFDNDMFEVEEVDHGS